MACFPGMPVIVRSVGSAVNPVDLHRLNPHRYPHLLQSTAQGRYDILFAFPGASLLLDADGKLDTPATVDACSSDFLECFDSWWRSEQLASGVNQALPFSGGWFVYLGYELVAQIESCLQLPAADKLLPTAVATRFATAVIVDHEAGTTCIVGEEGEDEAVRCIAADIDTLPISALCDLTVTRTDNFRAGRCDGNFFIDRTWRVTDICTGIFASDVQIIEIRDTLPPSIPKADIAVLGTEQDSCFGVFIVPDLNSTDSCSSDALIRDSIDISALSLSLIHI